ncbi:MAG: endolytic transglycosylase MltG [Beutenbergiaceae bacterium]
MTDLFQDSEQPPASPASRRSRRDRERANKRSRSQRSAQRRRTFVSFVVMLIAMGLLVAGGWFFVRPLFANLGGGEAEITDYPGPGSGSVDVMIHGGASGATIGALLVEADVVASVGAFTAAFSANPDAAGIQPGTYRLTQQIPATAAVEELLDPANRADAAITIPEGWRASQIYARVAELMGRPLDEVEAAAAQVELPEEAAGAIEGWLYPSTYLAAPDSTPAQVLQQMVDKTVSVLEANAIPRESWHDVIVAASIVELEVASAEDRAKVAQVIQNRLARCDGAGLLGMDTTLVYELGRPAGEITAAEWATPSPYNGRMVAGLPPTAISSPSEAAIQAAANPTPGDWCYFVTVNLDSGLTRFTADEAEFAQFVAELRQWESEQQGDN